ncbi:hypothetical protein NVP1244A_115 [Vibrio phage 1.244.A._10N.261.54.C3]|nr:hypothetical protein NVP1244A_115 [Vibrio phage 1.244.A._10N.261.54.C3]AUR98743.1 hypothetical protein NVP1255O_115 [Vibrio phage 1.255.O._10N.286.45.F1]
MQVIIKNYEGVSELKPGILLAARKSHFFPNEYAKHGIVKDRTNEPAYVVRVVDSRPVELKGDDLNKYAERREFAVETVWIDPEVLEKYDASDWADTTPTSFTFGFNPRKPLSYESTPKDPFWMEVSSVVKVEHKVSI